ncbi:MAG: NAD(P)/FAD-dependent oxidoreductase [Desulfitobacteriaceae bacterium]
MDFIWTNLRLPVEEAESALVPMMARKIKVSEQSISGFRVLRRALDARKKPRLFFVYSVLFSLSLSQRELQKVRSRVSDLKEVPREEPIIELRPGKKLKNRPVVVGSGPAGYFAALTLARKGFRPLVVERGDAIEERTGKVRDFWQTGNFDPESNVQFGEGGAGTFSDGKLTTRIQDSRIRSVLETFVQHGAPEQILFLAKPHVGTDILKGVVREIRREIESLGGEIWFRSKMTGLRSTVGRLEGLLINDQETLEAEAIILAVGHSARDVYQLLAKDGIIMESKAFAIGLRIEHPQKIINLAQYGVERHPILGSADYQLTYQDSVTGRGAYAFCMCPGGQVVAAASEVGGVVTNGMSEYQRDSGKANSALVVTVGTQDYPSNDPLAGIEFQRQWERRAFQAAGKNYSAPAQTVPDFLLHRVTNKFSLESSYQPGVVPCDLHVLLPKGIGGVLERTLMSFDSKLRGFAGHEATLTGVETRTSAPVRILRNEQGESVNLAGLFPTGEGAGYAGGIMSAAVDGIRAAERLMAQYTPLD